jgi:hypothetical protein
MHAALISQPNSFHRKLTLIQGEITVFATLRKRKVKENCIIIVVDVVYITHISYATAV